MILVKKVVLFIVFWSFSHTTSLPVELTTERALDVNATSEKSIEQTTLIKIDEEVSEPIIVPEKAIKACDDEVPLPALFSENQEEMKENEPSPEISGMVESQDSKTEVASTHEIESTENLLVHKESSMLDLADALATSEEIHNMFGNQKFKLDKQKKDTVETLNSKTLSEQKDTESQKSVSSDSKKADIKHTSDDTDTFAEPEVTEDLLEPKILKESDFIPIDSTLEDAEPETYFDDSSLDSTKELHTVQEKSSGETKLNKNNKEHYEKIKKQEQSQNKLMKEELGSENISLSLDSYHQTDIFEDISETIMAETETSKKEESNASIEEIKDPEVTTDDASIIVTTEKNVSLIFDPEVELTEKEELYENPTAKSQSKLKEESEEEDKTENIKIKELFNYDSTTSATTLNPEISTESVTKEVMDINTVGNKPEHAVTTSVEGENEPEKTLLATEKEKKTMHENSFEKVYLEPRVNEEEEKHQILGNSTIFEKNISEIQKYNDMNNEKSTNSEVQTNDSIKTQETDGMKSQQKLIDSETQVADAIEIKKLNKTIQVDRSNNTEKVNEIKPHKNLDVSSETEKISGLKVEHSEVLMDDSIKTEKVDHLTFNEKSLDSELQKGESNIMEKVDDPEPHYSGSSIVEKVQSMKFTEKPHHTEVQADHSSEVEKPNYILDDSSKITKTDEKFDDTNTHIENNLEAQTDDSSLVETTEPMVLAEKVVESEVHMKDSSMMEKVDHTASHEESLYSAVQKYDSIETDVISQKELGSSNDSTDTKSLSSNESEKALVENEKLVHKSTSTESSTEFLEPKSQVEGENDYEIVVQLKDDSNISNDKLNYDSSTQDPEPEILLLRSFVPGGGIEIEDMIIIDAENVSDIASVSQEETLIDLKDTTVATLLTTESPIENDTTTKVTSDEESEAKHPRFINSPSRVMPFRQGEPFVLQCETPEPVKYSWMKNGRFLRYNSKVFRESSEVNGNLLFVSPEMHDAGTYQCVAEDGLGRKSFTASSLVVLQDDKDMEYRQSRQRFNQVYVVYPSAKEHVQVIDMDY